MFMKSSCTPVGALDLARKIAASPHLYLREAMANPAPNDDETVQRRIFAKIQELA